MAPPPVSGAVVQGPRSAYSGKSPKGPGHLASTVGSGATAADASADGRAGVFKAEGSRAPFLLLWDAKVIRVTAARTATIHYRMAKGKSWKET